MQDRMEKETADSYLATVQTGANKKSLEKGRQNLKSDRTNLPSNCANLVSQFCSGIQRAA